MKPNYLLKNEFEYELRIREITVAVDVNSLRKQLRQAISSCRPALPEKFLTVDVQEGFSNCVKKLDDLEHPCIDSNQSCPLVATLIKSRSYLLTRFQNLSK
jgi:hypothetical protein